MPIDIILPASAGIDEGHVARWLKPAGSQISRGEAVVEIEADKATVEIEAPGDGTLEIVMAEGTPNVRVGTRVGRLLAAGELPSASPTASPKADLPAAPIASPVTLPASAVAVAPSMPELSSHAAAGGGQRRFASPLARRLAAQYHIDLAGLTGSGPHGRIVRRDVEQAHAQLAPSAHPAAIAAAVAAAQPDTAGAATAPLDGTYDALPHTAMRRTIARRLTEAKQSIPHFYLTIDVDLDALLAFRSEINADTNRKLSVNDFVIRAAALALRQIPEVNAQWSDDAVRRLHDVSIAVAVASPNGLVTPILRAADGKSLLTLANEMQMLAGLARDGRLRPEQYQGGSFTVSNLGMFGVREFAAIINPPQACILAIGMAEQRAVVRNASLAIATQMSCTLSADHRVVDGAVGARFLAAFKALLEHPLSLLI